MEVTLERIEQKWLIKGELTFATVVSLLKRTKIAWRDEKLITIDFSAITKVDSAALTLLLEWRRFAIDQSASIHFIRLPEQLTRLIELSGLNHTVEE